MEISFSDLKEKEIVNVYDGKKLGRVTDILFDNSSGSVQGIVVPGEKRLFHKSDEIFIPLEKLKRIGDDVILVGLQIEDGFNRNYGEQKNRYENANYFNSKNGVATKTSLENRKTYKNLENSSRYSSNNQYKGQSQSNNGSYVRFKRIDNKKYRWTN